MSPDFDIDFISLISSRILSTAHGEILTSDGEISLRYSLVSEVMGDLRLKVYKTEKTSCRPEVSLLCPYLYRLDVAIRLGKTKERVPCFERPRGNLYSWQIWSD